MKSVLIFVLLVGCLSCWAQTGSELSMMGVGRGTAAGGGGGCGAIGSPCTDDFAGTGVLSASWTASATAPQRYSGVAGGPAWAATVVGAYYSGGTFSANQVAQANLVGGTAGNYAAVCVRFSGSFTGYCARKGGAVGQPTLWKLSAINTPVNLGINCANISSNDGDLWVLSVTTSGGNAVLSITANGVACTSSYTDSTSPLLTGNPGFAANNGSSGAAANANVDNFSAVSQ